MPIYEYTCPDCGKEFELFVRGETRLACPGCDGQKIERRMSVPARPAGGAGASTDYSSLGPPSGGGGCCGGGGCGCH